MSPTQRTLKWLKDRGVTAAITERWNPHARIRQDLFGFIDLLALEAGEIVGIQVTSGGNISARMHKISNETRAIKWLQSGGKIVVHGWAKRTKGGRTVGYALRVATVCYVKDEGAIVWNEETIEPRKVSK